MITRIQARNYKCLKDVDVRLSPFQVLVGPNSSGKSTFMDVLGFIRDMLQYREGVDAAVTTRGKWLNQLTWNSEGGEIEFAVTLRMPDGLRARAAEDHSHCRYCVAIHQNTGVSGAVLAWEGVWTLEDPGIPAADAGGGSPRAAVASPSADLYPPSARGTSNHLTRRGDKGEYARLDDQIPIVPFKIHPAVPLLTRVPDDALVLAWARDMLMEETTHVVLDPARMREPCPPNTPDVLAADGSNLAKVVQTLKDRDPGRFEWWLAHLRTVLGELEAIRVVEQQQDRRLYIEVLRKDGAPVPAWLMSDGALRFVGLTLLAYMPDNDSVYLVEEPETGIHPSAIESVYHSLGSIYDGQVLVATHSPLMVGLAEPEQLLCFSRTESGETRIVRGHEHPLMRNWQKSVSLGSLYASGIFDGAE